VSWAGWGGVEWGGMGGGIEYNVQGSVFRQSVAVLYLVHPKCVQPLEVLTS